MLNRNYFSLLYLYSSLTLVGCGAIRTDPRESITLETKPPGASCVLSREGNVVGQVNPTPGDIIVDRNKHDMSVVCTKEGYQDGTGNLKSGLARTFFLNVLQMDALAVGVDAVTGADNSYPGVTTIELVPIAAPVSGAIAPP